ncbi:class I SAM-dependent methyltransferase [Picosynechococcus sp. NKBG15041c]|uniref:class I SAM-dependent methyltransferase n=1 Tax=Picosynechococcus sp. NKBG15041c TaxID=1407650 RepID=UPI00040819C8|nr:class I SAM-dependent methyltransferase [Picosynechococcus sp. NKBG15041c]
MEFLDYIDYDSVAEVYDTYAATIYDYDFFLSRLSPETHVLELTSGTGRLSIPLIKSGVKLTCVDISKGMINVLERKIKNEGLQANTICADVQYLEFKEEFQDVILPFQSFVELVGKEKQLNTLKAAYRALIPNGRFYCTMNNPIVRRKTVDGVMRGVGTFTSDNGYVVLSGFETGGNPIVQRSQFIDLYNSEGHLEKRIFQPMQFEMIEKETFRELAIEAGFEVEDVFGDYQASKFENETSPVMIWVLKK